jgi:hypothetical protein
MNLIKLSKQGKVVRYPYTVSMLKFENSNMSFPEILTADMLAGFNVVEVLPTIPPLVEYNQKVEETTPTKKNGKWYQEWKIVDLSEEELNTVIEKKSEEVRQKRNQLLVESDWSQISDSPVNKAPWVAYRQKLRDVTNQTGFPFGVIWPNKPV